MSSIVTIITSHQFVPGIFYNLLYNNNVIAADITGFVQSFSMRRGFVSSYFLGFGYQILNMTCIVFINSQILIKGIRGKST